ncbi:IPT/TIG domain-containing protein, partial [Azospirillum sp. B506]|uniref:IPT/TIG domain-containing protein n=1 Tax=Azospirillum sp. B506 TaxID=137721 RepID=UPI0019029198
PLYALIGDLYSNNHDYGASHFRVPDFRGFLPMGAGYAKDLDINAVHGVPLGERGVILLPSEMPLHTHSIVAVKEEAITDEPTGNGFAEPSPPYRAYFPVRQGGTAVSLNSGALARMKAGQPHSNIMPVLKLQYFICMEGIFPQQKVGDRPTISALEPPYGPSPGANNGQHSVKIVGYGFDENSTVSFGKNLATSRSSTPTGLDVTIPAGNGIVYVMVTESGYTSPTTNAARFTYTPSIFDMEPKFGSSQGGTPVKIVGIGFTFVTQVSGVYFGNYFVPQREITVVDDHTITLLAPPGLGAVDVQVVLGNGWVSEKFSKFAYIPSITSITPAFGSPTGGTEVNILGHNFTKSTQVSFSGTPVNDVKFLSNTMLKVKAPGGAGEVLVTATTADGTSEENATFFYRPILDKVTPAFGAGGSGGTVEIVGR